MDERKSVYVVVDDGQMTRVRSALEDVTSLIDSLRLGCEIAYRRAPTQEEGDAHEHRHDQSMGASYGTGECFVPMGSHHGWKCKCGTWVWGGPTVCQRCVDADAVKIAMECSMEATERLCAVRRLLEEHGCFCQCDHHPDERGPDCEVCLACRIGEAVGPRVRALAAETKLTRIREELGR